MEQAITLEEVLAAWRKVLAFGPVYWVPVTIFLSGFLGSFVNVCIWRLPRGESLAFQRSRCTSCNESLQVVDLLPVLSYVAMRGRCRHCRAPVPRRYLLVELWVIALWLVAWFLHGPGLPMLLTGGALTVLFTAFEIRKLKASTTRASGQASSPSA